MKNFISALAVSLFMLMVSTSNAHSQTLPSAVPLMSGCVGACGNNYADAIAAPASRFYKFLISTYSLCPSEQANGIIIVDGTIAWSGVVSAGTAVKFYANAGDKIALLVWHGTVNPFINCLWLGEVKFGIY